MAGICNSIMENGINRLAGAATCVALLSAGAVSFTACNEPFVAPFEADFALVAFFLPGRMPSYLQMIPSMISSAPPPMLSRRESRKTREMGVSSM